MADVRMLARELLEWLRDEPARVKDLESHRKALLEGAMEGQSGAITSGSGNGISFSQTAGMDAVQVARAIRLALRWFEDGTAGSGKTVAFFG